MAQYVIRRFMTALATIFGAMVLLFIMIQFMPGNPATILLGPRASPEIIASFEEKMGLNQPIHIQFGKFMFNVFQGDLGKDVLTHKPVRELVFNALPFTVVLAFSGMGVAAIIGIPLGAFAAAYRDSLLDKITGILSVSFITMPSFVKAIILLLIFSVTLRWFPATGGGEPGNVLDQLYHLVLPMTAIAIGWIGYIARLTRAVVLDELTEDYVRTARAKGVSERKTLYKHALRTAMVPVVSFIGVGFGTLLGGTVLTEVVFNRPGLGSLIYNAVRARNFPVAEGGLIIAVFLYALVNMFADLSHGLIDPRIRTE